MDTTYGSSYYIRECVNRGGWDWIGPDNFCSYIRQTWHVILSRRSFDEIGYGQVIRYMLIKRLSYEPTSYLTNWNGRLWTSPLWHTTEQNTFMEASIQTSELSRPNSLGSNPPSLLSW